MEISKWIAERLGKGNRCRIEVAENMPDPSDFDMIIMGSGIYRHTVLPSLKKYAETFYDALKGKNTVVFGVALDTKGVFVRGRVHGGWNYILPFMESLPEPPIFAGVLGGEINPDKLDEKDTKGLKKFYGRLHGKEVPIPYKTIMDKKEAWTFAEKVHERLESENPYNYDHSQKPHKKIQRADLC